MNIAIIGGGWVGCHLGLKLKDNHNVVIYEKNNKLFQETSYNNQNRLHYGYHYSRNHKTRELCKNTFNKFINDYGHLVLDVKKNCYCIPNNNSIIDFDTYLKIFEGFKYENITLNLNDIEGCINTNEKYINFKKTSDFFNEKLKDVFKNKKITTENINELCNNYDLVINATNNQLYNLSDDSFYELTISLIYRKIGVTEFDSLTMVDGDLFSIYPYYDDLYTLTDVEHTPVKIFKEIDSLKDYMSKIDSTIVNSKIKLFEEKVISYYPEFKHNFRYHSYVLSTKSKIINKSSSRYPVIEKSGNVINCFTGKIQGIYVIENYIKEIIDGKN